MKNIAKILLSITLIIVISCSNDDSPGSKQTGTPPLSEAFLILGDWQETSDIIDGEDLMRYSLNCVSDDVFTYTKYNQYFVDEGLTKCDEGDLKIKEEDHYFINGNQLTILGPASVTYYQILLLDKTTLKIKSNNGEIKTFIKL